MWIGAFGFIALGLLVTSGSIMAGRMVTPIRRLQEAAHHIGKGIWTEPLSIRTNDELEDLAEEVNRMNQELQAAFGGLRSEVLKRNLETGNCLLLLVKIIIISI